MARITKAQRQLIIFGVVLLACAAVLLYVLTGGSGTTAPISFMAPKIDQGFTRAVFDNPEYQKLSTPVKLPIQVGPLGNPNPFASSSETNK